MENQKSNKNLEDFQSKLNKLFSSPTLQSLKQFFKNTGPTPKDRSSSVANDDNFFDKVSKDITKTKKNIMKQFYNFYSLLKPSQIQQLTKKLQILIQPSQIILDNGIIILYSDLIQLKQQSTQPFTTLLQKILQILETLFRNHFIFKQMQKIDNRFTTKSFKIILSQKIINNSLQSLTSIKSDNSIKQFLAQNTFIQLKKNIYLRSIQNLIQEEVKGQEEEIQEAVEMCRICQNQFKLKVLENHVEYCSKFKAFQSLRQQVKEKQLEIIEKLNELVQNGECKRIYKNIINQFEQAPILRRRNSANHHKSSKKNVFKSLEAELDEFLQLSSDPILEEYRQLMKQRENVQKKMVNLQKNNLKRSQQNQRRSQKKKGKQTTLLSEIIIASHHPRQSTKSLKTSKILPIKTKKSIFAKISQNSQSIQPKPQHYKSRQKLKKNNSIKAHMQQILDVYSDLQGSKPEQQKLYRSLVNFNIGNDDLIREISIDDFQVVKFLGKGAFGKVYMVRRKKTRDIYALKVIKIQENWDQKELNLIKNQHQILSQIAGEFLVKAPFSFTEGQAHFFVLQYMPGGDLAKMIEEQVYLDFQQAQFYLAEIVLAIERIHEMGIIHRDLKPQNLIFDSQGHLKLTDFGLSQIRINQKINRVRKHSSTPSNPIQTPNSIPSQPLPLSPYNKQALTVHKNPKIKLIGTPDYIAPQVIRNESLDNLSIDWWSLGVIAYQMMIGCRPFCANTIDEVITNILEFNIQWPKVGQGQDMISEFADDFIRKLLEKDYRVRLGAKSVEEIKNHPFFNGIDWQNIRRQEPPLHPQIDPKQFYQYTPQIPHLKSQIKSSIGNFQAKSSIKLQNFIRYDILVQQTLTSVDKQKNKRQNKIKKLKGIISSFGNLNIQQDKENKQKQGDILSQEAFRQKDQVEEECQQGRGEGGREDIL